jgi:sulfate permease, SulP family
VALQQLHQSLQRRGVALRLVAVNLQPLSLMLRTGFVDQLGPAQLFDGLAQAALSPAPSTAAGS